MRRVWGIVAILAAGGLYLWHRQSPAQLPPQAAEAPPVVKIAAAKRDCLPSFVRGIGRVDPFNAVRLKSRVDGQIDRVLFVEGDEVKPGQILIEIDPRPYQAAITQAEGQLERDKAQLQAARADLDRQTALLQKGFATHQSYDQQSAQVGQLGATLKIDQALLDTAKLNLDFTAIKAPIAGRIGKRLVDAGNVIRAGDGTILAEIDQLQPVAILMTVPQEALPALQAGARQHKLAVEARGADERALIGTGELTLIGNSIDPQTGTIELKASFANQDLALWPGQFVTARIVTGMRNDVVAVPQEAVEPGPQGKFVYVVDADSAVAARTVTLGSGMPGTSTDGLAVIESGLQPGEKVVLDQHDRLKPGMKVVSEEQQVEAVTCNDAAPLLRS
jgi:membrane fusion protein, multidrug efflux system